MSSRRKVREKVMQALYAYELGGGDADHIVKHVLADGLDEDAKTLEFAKSLFLKTIEFAEGADEVIARHTKNWELGRIALVDRLLLRMAICELVNFEDIPPKVSINEAIEVAKKYSTSKSSKFINGILDTTLLTLQEGGELHKTGRGLVGLETIRRRSAP